MRAILTILFFDLNDFTEDRFGPSVDVTMIIAYLKAFTIDCCNEVDIIVAINSTKDNIADFHMVDIWSEREKLTALDSRSH